MPGEDFHLSVMAPLQAHLAPRVARQGRERGTGSQARRVGHLLVILYLVPAPAPAFGGRASRGRTVPGGLLRSSSVDFVPPL
jgi:hypothetical protein